MHFLSPCEFTEQGQFASVVFASSVLLGGPQACRVPSCPPASPIHLRAENPRLSLKSLGWGRVFSTPPPPPRPHPLTNN